MSGQILSQLTAIQRQRGETDEQFAVHLAICRAHWTRIRLGKRSLTYRVVKRAAQRFPEVYVLAIADLSAPEEKAS